MFPNALFWYMVGHLTWRTEFSLSLSSQPHQENCCVILSVGLSIHGSVYIQSTFRHLL